MRKKIFRSIFIVALVILLASIGIATSFLYRYFNNSQVNRLKAELSLVADTVNEIGIEYFENFNSTVFRFTVIDPRGNVLYDTQAEADTMENHAHREEIQEALHTGAGSSARISSTLTQKTFYEAVKLDSGDILRISVSQMTVSALVIGMFPAILVILCIAAMVAFSLSHGMAKKLTEPLRNLDLENPTENNTYEELSPILTKIHKQHKQIKTQMNELRRRSQEFEQIISSMNEGLVLLDETGIILSMNPSARKIFSATDDIVGSDFLLTDRSTKMCHAIRDALKGKRKEYTDQKDGCQYQFTVNSILSDGKILGVVILAFDISESANAEQNRQEFTANVTHELKTPLQSILGSAELLEYGLAKPDDTVKFAGNIRREAKRLVSLIDDIIRLSQLDENHEPVTETVELIDVAKEVADVLSDAAGKKDVDFKIAGTPEIICGVRRYIYEIIYNLCDNAIRYNKVGGSVTIRLGKESGRPFVTVSDTGIGIAPEHQNRIFERFYRVDKSHSRETGGTGLGLSIVKHAVQYHGGKVVLDSEVGTGTTITILF